MSTPGRTDGDLSETPDTDGAAPRLDADQIRALSDEGRRQTVQAGDVLIAEGQRERDFLVILSGKVGVYDGYGTPAQRLIRVHGPGRFLDEIGLLTGQPAFVSSIALEAGEVLAVPWQALRDTVHRRPELGDLILRAFLCRREFLIDAVAGMRIVGSRYSPDVRRLREFAARNRIPHTWIDLEEDPHAAQLLERLGVAPSDTPVVIWRGNQVLRKPDNAELARVVGLRRLSAGGQFADVVVVGAGPAGLAAAVYAASEGLSTVVVDAVATGGQAGTSSRIENYLGFPAGISGAELADRAVIQAEKFGATITVPAEAIGLEARDSFQTVRFDDGTEITTHALVIATGARYRRLAVPRLDEFEGSSVYYAATMMEARFCERLPVVVVGGGNSAGQAAVFLARHATRVDLLIRHDDLARDMSRYLVERVERSPAVTVRRHTEVRELVGDGGQLRAIVVEDNRTGAHEQLEAALLFVFIGAEPCTGWLRGRLALDPRGYICTGPDAADDTASGRPPTNLETSRPGVLAVGDVRSGSIKRVASAVGEGAMAVRLVHEYLARP
ncbi:thioredoxin reductase [Virgisporangium aliadipatigenens]|uniref:Thioredoxin reductase n=1 Tax=Virgisporangium aliadipatigenens TaxID=741659 RepID=A0A8J3YTL0_9ACTN|nr:cyclic nucleotide-binding domain-containing thioredoxin-disulfide reductase [Virgisporangium aliadipatigenens]GIJ49581.1 thioredoxin reductase [Virgisporangium aliadipatigenens]